MNNETITFLHKLIDKLDNARRYDDEGDRLDSVWVVSNAIQEMIDEENPEQGCEPEPWAMRMERERANRESPMGIKYVTPWKVCINPYKGTEIFISRYLTALDQAKLEL